jgi:hypothetical protein
MRPCHWLLIPVLGIAEAVCAQFPGPGPSDIPQRKPPTMEEAKSRIKKVGDGEYTLGDIHFSSKTHQISFPAEINMTEGVLEYALVHVNGKTHESLLSTKIRPFDLNVVMLLCRYEPHVGDLITVLKDPPEDLKKLAAQPMTRPKANQLRIRVQWKDAKGSHDLSLQEMILALANNRPLSTDHFDYNGSQLYEGRFEADREGSFIALYIDFLALINSVEARKPDELPNSTQSWIPNKDNTPPLGTPVTMVFSPVP